MKNRQKILHLITFAMCSQNSQLSAQEKKEVKIGSDVYKLESTEVTERMRLNMSTDWTSSIDKLKERAELLESPAVSSRNWMSEVQNQGSRGTCSVFSAIGLLEFKTSNRYSEQCLAKYSSDSDPGVIAKRVAWARDNGLWSRADCPYDEKDRENIPSNLTQLPKLSIEGSYTMVPQQSENILDQIRNSIRNGSAVGISVVYREYNENSGKQWSARKYPECFDLTAYWRGEVNIQNITAECYHALLDNAYWNYLKSEPSTANLDNSTRSKLYWEVYHKRDTQWQQKLNAAFQQSSLYIPIIRDPGDASKDCTKDPKGQQSLEVGEKNQCSRHAIVATGFDDNLGLIEFKNSWGTSWGHAGYGYMTYDYYLKYRTESDLVIRN